MHESTLPSEAPATLPRRRWHRQLASPSATAVLALWLLLAAGCDNGNPTITPATAEDVLRAVRESGGRAVLVNVWATWCIPCREEFPDLMQVYEELHGEGLELVLVSADFSGQTDAARAFLASQGVDFPSFQKVGKDQEFIDTLDPRWSGVLPATWIFDGSGGVRYFWENKASYEVMRSRIEDVLGG